MKITEPLCPLGNKMKSSVNIKKQQFRTSIWKNTKNIGTISLNHEISFQC